MNNREFFKQRWEAEQPAFLRVLRALPSDRLDYTPHERSSKAGDLAWQLVQEQKSLVDLLGTKQIDWQQSATPDHAAMVAEWERVTRQLREALDQTDDETWSAGGKFLMGGQVAWEAPISELFWGFLFDMVHHRGQLSTYIRPMGGKVPSIYGPSADDGGGA